MFKGTGVAIVTPFKSDFSVDYQALENLTQHLITNKVDYIVALGTTGETPTLTHEEKYSVAKVIKDVVNKRIPLVLGIGGNNTAEVLKAIEKGDVEGYHAILSVCPYYNKPTQKGIYLHYKQISENSPLPLIIYNVPGRTGVNISAETTLQLAADCKNIIATKEACGNMEQIMTIIRNRPEGFLVISGDDAITFPLIACGADGVISVTANALPLQFSEMVRKALKGDFANAKPMHMSMLEFYQAMFAEGSPSGVKAALNILGMLENVVRLPMVSVSDPHYNHIAGLLNKINS